MIQRLPSRARAAIAPATLSALALVLGASLAAQASDNIAPPPDGEALYNERCAACHDNAVDRTPARDVLAKNPPSFIIASLTNGAMAPMAEGLSGAEKAAIAAYITGTKLPPVAGDIDPNSIWGPSAASMPLDAPKCETPAPPIKLNAAGWNGWSPSSRYARYQDKPGLKAADVSRL